MCADDIVKIVCRSCRIRVADLKRRSRAEPLPTARALIAHFLYKEMGMTPREILPLAGHHASHRTGVYHYLGRKTLVERRSPYQRKLRERVMRIERSIKAAKAKTNS